MKSITVRIDDKQKELIAELQEIHNEKTASKVLLNCLDSYKPLHDSIDVLRNDNIWMKSHIGELEMIIKYLRYLDDEAK